MTDFGSLCTKPVIYSIIFVQTQSCISFLFISSQFQSNQRIISEEYYNQLRQYLHSSSLLVSCTVVSYNNVEKSSDRKLNSTIRGFSVFCYLLRFMFLYIWCFFASKNAFVSFTTTPLSANNAIIFGIAISPLKISAMVHTALTVMYGPINTARM